MKLKVLSMQLPVVRKIDVHRLNGCAASPASSKLIEELMGQDASRPKEVESVKYDKDQLDITFNNTKSAYKSKTMSQLLRNYFVLGLCSREFLVKNNTKLMKLSRSLLGKRLFEKLMVSTFYGQFVAGQNEEEIAPIVKHLSSFGVKTILDYSAEEDVNEEEQMSKESSAKNENVNTANYNANTNTVPSSPMANVGATNSSAINDDERNKDKFDYLAQVNSELLLRRYQQPGDFVDCRKYLPVARTYFYGGELQCEKNLKIFFGSIEAVAKTTGNTGFAAIKLTALGRPRLLMKLSKIIDYMKQVDAASNYVGVSQQESLNDLLKRFNSLDQQYINPLDEDEEEMLFNLMRRVNRIAAYASQVGGARCMIDAEQTYMQPAINRIAMELMRQYNRNEAIIFNTYQCYLKSAFDQAKADLAQARRENFYFGAKLVRGAYMDQERARALKLNYEDPINESFEATSQMYEKTLSYLMGEIQRELQFNRQDDLIGSDFDADNNGYQSLEGATNQSILMEQMEKRNRRICIMVASHNEETVRFALNEMARRGIEPSHKVICFGQLYGMCDHISFTLGQSGYSVYKYAPYGPIEEVLPYLGRRAIENHGFLSKLNRERGLLSKEIVSRLLQFNWFYKPMGNYRTI